MSDATATNPISDPKLRAFAVEVDTRLAGLDEQYARLTASRSAAVSTIRNLNGERAVYHGRRRVFETPVDESIANLRAKLATGELASWDVDTAKRALDKLDGLDLQIANNRARADEEQATWAMRGRWSRFFLVPGGHIHYDVSSHRCSRQWSTQHGWNPQLSGLTEAEAVAELGPLLCTVCFPSAPVEWTVGHAKPARCAGSGRPYVDGSRRGRYGKCRECGDVQSVTSIGNIRAHKPADS